MKSTAPMSDPLLPSTHWLVRCWWSLRLFGYVYEDIPIWILHFKPFQLKTEMMLSCLLLNYCPLALGRGWPEFRALPQIMCLCWTAHRAGPGDRKLDTRSTDITAVFGFTNWNSISNVSQTSPLHVLRALAASCRRQTSKVELGDSPSFTPWTPWHWLADLRGGNN